jgi:hypothetical protein
MPEDPRFRPHPAVLHVLGTLPDSVRLRKELLEDCLILLASEPDTDPLRERVKTMLDLLRIHERLQCELPLTIAPLPPPNNQHQ